MDLGSYFVFLQEQIKDIIIIEAWANAISAAATTLLPRAPSTLLIIPPRCQGSAVTGNVEDTTIIAALEAAADGCGGQNQEGGSMSLIRSPTRNTP
jgi:hypothetical protein